jgi:hypothetical protein
MNPFGLTDRMYRVCTMRAGPWSLLGG